MAKFIDKIEYRTPNSHPEPGLSSYFNNLSGRYEEFELKTGTE